jgi:hypothetical protein
MTVQRVEGREDPLHIYGVRPDLDLTEFLRGEAYFNDHFPEIHDRYKGQYIAIVDGHVIEHSPSLTVISKFLAEHYPGLAVYAPFVGDQPRATRRSISSFSYLKPAK